jgi:hypothetical protein
VKSASTDNTKLSNKTQKAKHSKLIPLWITLKRVN